MQISPDLPVSYFYHMPSNKSDTSRYLFQKWDFSNSELNFVFGLKNASNSHLNTKYPRSRPYLYTLILKRAGIISNLFPCHAYSICVPNTATLGAQKILQQMFSLSCIHQALPSVSSCHVHSISSKCLLSCFQHKQACHGFQ